MENVTERIGDGIHSTPTYNEYGDYFFINGNNLVDGKIKIFNNWIKLIATTFNNLTLFHNYATYPYKNSLAESGKAIKVYFVGGSQKDS